MPISPRQRARLVDLVDVVFTPADAERRRHVDNTHTGDGKVRAEEVVGALPASVMPATTLAAIPAPEGSGFNSLDEYIDAIASTYAPIGATFIVQTADATLTNEQVLGALATGLLKNTTATGVLTIAVAGTDYARVPLTATATLNFPSIGAANTADADQELTITVTGAAVGDAVVLGPPAALEAGLSATGYVSAADTVTVRLANHTNAAVDPASATFRATVIKP